MRKYFSSLLLCLCATVLLVACGKKAPKEAKYIPKDATAVIVVDPQSLEDKLKSGSLTMDSIMKAVMGKDTISAKDKEKFDELKDAVDFESKCYLFLVQKGSMKDGQSMAVNVMGTMKDATKFEAFLKKQDQLKDKAITKEKDYSYIEVADGGVISWTNDIVIGTYYNNYANKEVYDTITHTWTNPNAAKGKADLKAEVARYYSLKESDNIASIGAFNDMFKEKADGYAFTTSAGSLAALSMLPLSIPKLEDLLKDNYSVMTLNFQDGKIVAKGTGYTNPMLSNILKTYAGPTVKTEMIENYPSQHVNGVVLASFNPQIFTGILKELQVDGMVNGYLTQVGLTSDDIFKALKGDIAVVVSDFGVSNQPKQMGGTQGFTYNTPTPSAKMIFNATIGDKVAFAKLMDKAAEKGIVTKQNGIYIAGPAMAMANLYLHVDDKNLILASDQATYDAYASGKGKSNLSSDVKDKLKGKATAGYIDISSIVDGIAPITQGNEMSKNIHNAVSATFKDAFMTMDNFDGNLKSGFEVRMKDDKQNSLVSLAKMMITIAQETKKAFAPQTPEVTLPLDSIPKKN